MKKLFNILILLAFTLSLSAQIYEGKKYLGQSSDTINSGTYLTKTWELAGDKPYNFAVLIRLDSIAGTPKAVASLEYSVGGEDFKPLMLNDTVAYSDTAQFVNSDTAFIMEKSTQIMGNYLRLKVAGIDSTQTTKVTAYFKNWYINKF